jgi:hypothetical protein
MDDLKKPHQSDIHLLNNYLNYELHLDSWLGQPPFESACSVDPSPVDCDAHPII